MGKFLTIANTSEKGMFTDTDPWVLPPNAFTHLMNVRSIADSITPHGGFFKWKDLTDTPNYVISFETITGTALIIVDVVSKKISYIYRATDTPIDITGDFKFTGKIHITYAVIGDILVVNNGSTPYYLTNRLTGFTILPWSKSKTWADIHVTANIIARHGQYLFAMDLTDTSGDEIHDAVRWSSPADINDLPETWDELDTTNYAGFTRLAGNAGKVVAGLSLRDSFVVYREHGVHVFDYVGGAYVWKIRQVTDGKGALSSESVVEVSGLHYVMARDDIYVFDGRNFTPITIGKVRESYLKSLDPDLAHKAYVTINSFHNELLFCLTENGHEQPNMALIYNYVYGTWAYRRFKDLNASGEMVGGGYTTIIHAHIATEPNTWDSPDNAATTWREIDEIWSGSASTPLAEDTLIGIDVERKTLDIIDGHGFKNSGAEAMTTIIERVGIVPQKMDDVTTLVKGYLHFRGEGNILIEFGEQQYPNAPVIWRERLVVDVGKKRKVDFRSTGRLHAYRISGSSSESWKYGGMTIEYVEAGTR